MIQYLNYWYNLWIYIKRPPSHFSDVKGGLFTQITDVATDARKLYKLKEMQGNIPLIL